MRRRSNSAMRARATRAIAWRKREPRRGEDAVAARRRRRAAPSGSRSHTRTAGRTSKHAGARQRPPRARRSATSRRRSSRRSSRARRRPCPESRPGTRRRRSRASPRTARPWDSPRRPRRRSSPSRISSALSAACRTTIGAADAAIAHQQIAAEADHRQRLVRRQLADEGREIVAIGRARRRDRPARRSASSCSARAGRRAPACRAAR